MTAARRTMPLEGGPIEDWVRDLPLNVLSPARVEFALEIGCMVTGLIDPQVFFGYWMRLNGVED